MSGASEDLELEAGTSGMMESSMMESEEYYNPEGSEWSQKVDTGQLCRVCANPNEYLIPIFDGEGLEHELGMKIQKHLPIQVAETDSLPQQVCYQCASTLIAWHDLVISCVEADKKLRELQVEDDDDGDDDKGAEMFESPSLDSEMADDAVQPSKSETQTQVTKTPSPKKIAVIKEKKPKLKMVLVKGPPAGTSGQKTASKTQVAKALELAKSKDGASQDSTSERYDESSENLDEEFQLHVIEIIPSPLRNDEDKDEFKVEFESELDGDDKSMGELFGIETCNENYQGDIHMDIEQQADIEVNDSSHQEVFVGVDSSSVDHRDEYYEFVQDDVLRSGKDEDIRDISSNMQHENIGTNADVSQEADASPNPNPSIHDSAKVSRENQYWSADVAQPKEYSKENIPDLSNVPENVLRETTGGGFINVYSCSACDEDFVSFAELTAHMKYHIPGAEKPKHACTVCDRKFLTAGALEHHVKIRSCKPEKCDICEKTYKSKNMLALHKLTHGTTNPHPCQYCNRNFLFASSLEQHLIVDHIDKLEFLCKGCNKVFHSKLELIIHRKSHPKVEFKRKDKSSEYLCYICGDVFDTVRKLKSHEKRIHEDSKMQQKPMLRSPSKYICEVCGKIFKFPALLKNHAVVHQRPKEYFVCEICGVVRKSKWLLQQHQTSHSNRREHVCRVCRMAYKTYNALVIHERNCHGIVSLGQGLEKVLLSFPCEFCKREFTTQERLDIHVRIHTGERPFQCKECDKGYSSRNALRLHQAINHRMHKKRIKRVFTCNICGKTFTTKGSLNMHMNIHTGERPFKCKICNKAFTQKGGLVQHIVYHTDMRSYVCTLCGKGFLRKSHLKIHIQTHTGEKPHMCDICGRAFSQLGDMRKHRQKLHSAS